VKNSEKVRQIIVSLEDAVEVFRKTVEVMGNFKVVEYSRRASDLNEAITLDEKSTWHVDQNRQFYQKKTQPYSSRKKINKRAVAR